MFEIWGRAATATIRILKDNTPPIRIQTFSFFPPFSFASTPLQRNKQRCCKQNKVHCLTKEEKNHLRVVPLCAIAVQLSDCSRRHSFPIQSSVITPRPSLFQETFPEHHADHHLDITLRPRRSRRPSGDPLPPSCAKPSDPTRAQVHNQQAIANFQAPYGAKTRAQPLARRSHLAAGPQLRQSGPGPPQRAPREPLRRQSYLEQRHVRERARARQELRLEPQH